MNGGPIYFPTVRVEEKVVQGVSQVKKEVKDGTSLPDSVPSVGGDNRGGYVARKKEYKEDREERR